MTATPDQDTVPVAKRHRKAAAKPAVKLEPKKVTVRIDPEVLALAQGAHRLLYGLSLQNSFSEFAEAAFAREVERIQAEHNGGKPLTPEQGGLRAGRKV